MRATRRALFSAASWPPPGGKLYVWGTAGPALGMKLPAEVYGGAKAFLRPGGSVAPPLLHPHLTDVVSVVCRAERTLALTSDGSVYTWGTCVMKGAPRSCVIPNFPPPSIASSTRLR